MQTQNLIFLKNHISVLRSQSNFNKFTLFFFHDYVWVTYAQPLISFWDNNHMIIFDSLNISTTEFISVVLLHILDPNQVFIQDFPNY